MIKSICGKATAFAGETSSLEYRAKKLARVIPTRRLVKVVCLHGRELSLYWRAGRKTCWLKRMSFLRILWPTADEVMAVKRESVLDRGSRPLHDLSIDILLADMSISISRQPCKFLFDSSSSYTIEPESAVMTSSHPLTNSLTLVGQRLYVYSNERLSCFLHSYPVPVLINTQRWA
ncbi:hypothetical protein BDV98DRAFT_314296 [Pterulicium gracile]|uniref:Uncharacterized protein n=1 Tax=Pterulicium gracile TaxID=1884261 RepID=A0A5C3QS33_9AGAR|nr:hypothetical protein BDV98DRAFT_314296 [Pterula gracilis]